jgi:hypothetical protein
MQQTFERVVNEIQGLGRTWATYGLTFSKNVLEQSADRLKITAEFLGTVSEQINRIEEAPEEPETKPEPEVEPAKA